jgi:hypothetical protein
MVTATTTVDLRVIPDASQRAAGSYKPETDVGGVIEALCEPASFR